MIEYLELLDSIVWGPVTLVLLLGTGIYLMVRMQFLPLRNLGYALRCAIGRDDTDRQKRASHGAVSPFSALMTELAATIGTGNIVGVATAMVLGGPGALFWMIVSALTGMATKLAESLLSVRYRTVNGEGKIAGGPMYVMERGMKNRRLGKGMGSAFALFAVGASLGMGNMTQSNSIAQALSESFQIPVEKTGLCMTILTILAILGGIGTISRITGVLVPCMAVFYIFGTLFVIGRNLGNLPQGIGQILQMAFTREAVVGGTGGSIVVTMQQAVRWGVSRGVFTNEAGLGAAGISAAAADTDDPVRQGYISMTGVFLDTIVICTLTGLAIVSSGVLGRTDENGIPLTGAALTIEAFSTAFGEAGAKFISIGIVLFAFATILGWEYQGEKAFEFLVRSGRWCMLYRFVYALFVFVGAVCALNVVWSFSDIMNALMAIPNLTAVWLLSGEACRAVREHRWDRSL